MTQSLRYNSTRSLTDASVNAEPFITLDNITVRLGGAWLLQGLSWEMRDGENWVVWGANGAGKTTLAKALLGDAAVVQGAIRRHYRGGTEIQSGQGDIALVSSDQQFDLHRREQMLDQMRHFSGRIHDVTRAGDLFCDAGGQAEMIDLLRLDSLLAKPLNALSAGEMRRLLIGRALMRRPRLLILDEPYNGLDTATCAELRNILNQLGAAGTRMVLITHRPGEIAETFTHLLHLDQGRAVWAGPVEAFTPPSSELAQGVGERQDAGIRTQGRLSKGGAPIIEMKGIHVAYGDTDVLKDIRWTVHAGENWALTGPNGAGKSTLLKLITGDNLQGYANDLKLFGRPKGSGESIWEIKQRIGYVADDLQLRYQKRMSGFDVVCSGFFDSVGLFRLCSARQKATARDWLDRTGASDLGRELFSRLSFGQQRMLLILRAMVKTPGLLILDEPCNGLDVANRRRLLEMLNVIAADGATSLLYVSHREEEMPDCISHRLRLSAGRVVD